MHAANQTKPGDLLLDRYLAGVDEDARDAARSQWKGLIRALLQVATRVAEDEEREAQDSQNSDRRRRIRSLP